MQDFGGHSHRRYNPLSGNWVLVSPERVLRPWQGQEEMATPQQRPTFDPECYLCPGNARATGDSNPAYSHTYAFTNDFPALGAASQAATTSDGLLQAEWVAGTSRVLCYSPRHDLSLSDLPVQDIARVIEMWIEQSIDLGRTYRWVQVFENKGELMGCSNPHPHGQVWALDALPGEAAREDVQQRNHYAACHSPLLLDYARQELELRERIVLESEHWLLLVPYWAQWPFETLLLPRRQVARLPDLTPMEQQDLASMLQRLLRCYDQLFQCSFPYTMGWHGAPFDERDTRPWLLHAHYYPPLLRSATVKKFMVGYELLAETQRDFTPEMAALRLRDVAATFGQGMRG